MCVYVCACVHVCVRACVCVCVVCGVCVCVYHVGFFLLGMSVELEKNKHKKTLLALLCLAMLFVHLLDELVDLQIVEY